MCACKKCGGTEYYRLGRLSGTYAAYYNADGSPSDNCHLHDGANYKEQKTRYCANCNSKMPKIKEPTNEPIR